MGPARMIVESLTPRPREHYRPMNRHGLNHRVSAER